MKKHLFLVLFFSFLCFQAQEQDFCKDFLQKEKVEFVNFKKAQLENKYSALRDKIFTDIRKSKEVLTDNIHLFIVSNTFVNDYISSDSENDCRYQSTLYLDKRTFLDSLFWNKDTFDYVKKHFNKNIFPVINHNGSFHLTKENFKNLFSNGEYLFINNFSTTYFPYKKENVFYIPNKKAKLSSGFTRVLIVFKDYKLVNKVEVQIENSKGLKTNSVEKKYLFINNQWKLIEKKEKK